jgi:hypothetical protein
VRASAGECGRVRASAGECGRVRASAGAGEPCSARARANAWQRVVITFLCRTKRAELCFIALHRVQRFSIRHTSLFKMFT